MKMKQLMASGLVAMLTAFTAMAADLTGAVASVSADDLLAGKVAGVQVTSVSGQPGAAPSIRVRGYSSQGNSSPLFIIDGVQGDLSDISPDDIESIDVLKDAAASALYGARAANGVILVTTKQGTAMPIILVDGIIYIGRISDIPQSDIESMTILKDASSSALYGARAGSGVILVTTKNPRVDASLAPLYVVDGVAGGDFSAINPADIMSLEVLKDASATAIYGVKGANGVIIITTRFKDAATYTLALTTAPINSCGHWTVDGVKQASVVVPKGALLYFWTMSSTTGDINIYSDAAGTNKLHDLKWVKDTSSYSWAKWSVEGNSTIITNDMEISAVMAMPEGTYGIRAIAEPADGGTVSASPETYVSNALPKSATLAATAADGYKFIEWTVKKGPEGASVSGDTLTIPADVAGDIVVAAKFEALPPPPPPTMHTLTLSTKPDNGYGYWKVDGAKQASVEVPEGAFLYFWNGSSLTGEIDIYSDSAWTEKLHTLQWFNESKYDWSKWSTNSTVITSDMELAAVVFIPPVEYGITVTADPAEGGEASAAASKYAFNENEEQTVELTATAAKGYEFVAWEVSGPEGVSVDGNTLTIPAGAAGDIAVTAKFRTLVRTLTLTTAPINNCGHWTVDGVRQSFVEVPKGALLYFYNTSSKDSAIEIYSDAAWTEKLHDLKWVKDTWSYDWAKWSVEGNPTTITNDMELSAVMAMPEGKYGISTIAEPAEGGAVSASPETYVSNTVSQTSALTANAADGYEFVGWTVKKGPEGVSVSGNTLTLPANAAGDIVVVAEFNALPPPPPPPPPPPVVTRTLTLSTKPHDGYGHWTVDGATQTSVEVPEGAFLYFWNGSSLTAAIEIYSDAAWTEKLHDLKWVNDSKFAWDRWSTGSTVIATDMELSAMIKWDPVAYLDWDDENGKMTNATCTAYELYEGQTTLEPGTTYVVKEIKTVSSAITVNGTEAEPTRLILCDGVKLTAEKGIVVAFDGVTTNALVICAQSEDAGTMGAIEATGGKFGAGIGGSNGAGGAVTINGGAVTATGGLGGAGIGGGDNGAGGVVTINGGSVTATGFACPAIGCGNLLTPTNVGTVAFSSGFTVVTGETAAVTAPIAQEEYENDHGAKFVRIAQTVADRAVFALKDQFDEPSMIEPISKNGVYAGVRVILGKNCGPIELPDDLGEITIVLNGWKISDTDGADGDGVTPGEDGIAPITVVPGGAVRAGATVLTVVDAVQDPADYLVIDLKTGKEEHQTIASVIEAERFTNEIYKTEKLVLRWIPEGDYAVGFGEETDHNLPAFTATVNDGYYIGLFEFTEAQYSNALGVAGCTSTRPLTAVTWNEFDKFLKVLNKKTSGDGFKAFGKAAKKSITLPTELQWEIAARGGSAAEYGAYVNAAGKTVAGTADNFGDFAWYVKNNTPAGAKPVGLKRPNAFGLYDTAGNVWEWCLDSWETPYDTSRTSAEEFCTAEGTDRVMRGGSYNDKASVCRPSYRGCNGVDYRDVYNGFRLALVNSEGPEPVERPEPGKGSALVCGDGGEGNPAGKGCTNGVEIAEGASSAVTVDIDTDAVQVIPGKDGREIAAVTFLQRYPWNGLVDIGFALKLEPAAETDLLVTVYDGETTLDSFAVPAAADASGAFATNIVWDAAAAGLAADFQSDNVFVEVEADRSAKSPALLATARAGTIYGSRGSNGVIIITTKQGAGAVPYLDWDDVNKKLTNATCTAYTVVTNDMDVLEAGKTYVVMGNVTNSVGIVVEGTADNPTYLILCDGAKLVSTECFRVVAQGATTNALVICGQENGTGVLEASSSVGIMGAGIGGGGNQDCGIVTINGGTIVANGFTGGAAGIGGGRPVMDGPGSGGTVTINGGTVTAIGTTRAEGIGRGWNSFGEKGKYSGTVKFGSEFTVLAGDDAESAMPVAQEDYERDHSAKYVHIEQAPRSWRVASSAKGRVDLRPAVALVADPTDGAPVSNVTWSTTYWAGYIGSLSVNIGWTNLTSGVAGKIDSFGGSGVTNVALPAYSGEYKLIHSVGDLESFVTFTVDGLTNRTVMLPTALAGCHYVVSNLTTGAEIAASGTLIGGAEYDLPLGDKIAIYAVPGAGYTVVGTNPYVIEKVTQLTDVDATDLPSAVMPVAYLDWDDEEKRMTNATCLVYETVTAQTSEFAAGKTYVVRGSVVNEGVITVNGTEDDPTRLILCDGASLEVNGIIVNGGYGLVICGQEKGTGELVSDADGNGGNPGIGGEAWSFEGCGAITINGGTVTAIGDWAGAGIGGGEGEDGGTITINGGKVTAVGNVGNGGSMAIGCGADGFDEGTINFGSEFIVKAGDSAESAVCVAMESYAADHTARYVRIAKASDSEGTRLDPWYVGDQPKWGVVAYTNELADTFALYFANAASSFDLTADEYAPFRETARVIVETANGFWIEPSLWRASDGEEYGTPAEAYAAGATNAVPVFYDEDHTKIPSSAEIERGTNGVNFAEWRNVETDVSDPLRAMIVSGLRRIADAERADVLLELVPEDTNTVLEAAVDVHIDAILSELGVAEESRAKSVVDLNGWLGEAATNEFTAPILLAFQRQIDNGRISFMMRQDADGSVELLPEVTSILDLATTNCGFLVDRDFGVVYVVTQKLGSFALGEVAPETFCSIVVGDGTKALGEEDPASLATNFTVYAFGKGVSADDFVGYCERMKGEAAGKYAISFTLLKKPEGFPRSAIVVRPGVFTITDDVDIVAQWAAEDLAAGYPTNGYAHVRLSCDPAMGKVKGEKVYKLKYDKKTGVSSVKVSISATAAKDYVFAGWYEDPGFSTPATFWTGTGTNAKPKDYRNASQSITVTTNTYLFARFVKKSSTADPITWLRYAGAGYCGADASWLAEEETWYQGVALPTNACQIAFGSLSLPTVTVSGLPSGVKFDKTTCRFTGVPTACSTAKKPFFTVKVTVKNKSGANDVLVKYVTVEPLPAWAVGNFDGYHVDEGVTNGTFTATVGKTGKVSGKTKGGLADTTFSAKNFSEVRLAEDGTNLVYVVDVTVSYKDPSTKKTVKEVDTLCLAEDVEMKLGVIGGGDEDGCGSVGVQRAWDRKADTSIGFNAFPAFDTKALKGPFPLGNGLTLKFGAKGKVTVGGTVNGIKASGSTYVLPFAWQSTMAGNLLAQVPVYVAPTRNSAGFCAVYDVLLTAEGGKFVSVSPLEAPLSEGRHAPIVFPPKVTVR